MTNTSTRRALMAGAAATGVLAALPVTAGNHFEVEIRNFKFTPTFLKVKAGDTVRWTNRDGAPHDATGLDGSWKTKILHRNESDTITVSADMFANYFCSVHPNMQAKLTIETA
jgi:plastocyanin